VAGIKIGRSGSKVRKQEREGGKQKEKIGTEIKIKQEKLMKY
jgi:hypothetical protein